MTPIQRIRVPAGLLFALLYLYFCQPTPRSLLLGAGLVGAGVGLRLWASGHIEKGRQLSTRGPYAWTRNPLYLGSFLMGLGFSLAASVGWLLVLFVVLFLGIYLPVMQAEETELLAAFGQEFQSYQKQVPMFLPLPPAPGQRDRDHGLGRNFQWQRVILNREHRSVAGIVLLAAIVLVKALWN